MIVVAVLGIVCWVCVCWYVLCGRALIRKKPRLAPRRRGWAVCAGGCVFYRLGFFYGLVKKGKSYENLLVQG